MVQATTIETSVWGVNFMDRDDSSEQLPLLQKDPQAVVWGDALRIPSTDKELADWLRRAVTDSAVKSLMREGAQCGRDGRSQSIPKHEGATSIRLICQRAGFVAWPNKRCRRTKRVRTSTRALPELPQQKEPGFLCPEQQSKTVARSTIFGTLRLRGHGALSDCHRLQGQWRGRLIER